jgi:hypothetical protein
MNEQEIASPHAPDQTAAASHIPGVARVSSINPNLPVVEPSKTSTLMGDFVARILVKISGVLSPVLIESALAASKRLGHLAVLAGAALTVAYAVFAAIKYNSFMIFATGLGFVVALAVAQFAASRFLDAADTLIAGTPSRISSSAFLDCAGLLVLLLAVATLCSGIAGAIASRSIVPLLPAVVVGLALTCFGAVSLHPNVVNVGTGGGTAGEEAIGLLSFFFKSALKLVPLFFLLFSVVGSLTVLLSFFGEGGAFASMAQSLVNVLPLPASASTGLTGSALVLVACLVPIFGYFVFLLQYLIIDVLRAVLAVPAKLDALRR